MASAARSWTRAFAELEARLRLSTVTGDATDPALADAVLGGVRPTVLVLNAGATPVMAPLHAQTWEAFSTNWNTDVKATFHWVQSALRLPLARGARVLLTASGAAIDGSPLSGGYAGAKRMIWLMVGYANGVARDLGLGIRFQALLLRQLVGTTEVGRAAAEAYGSQKGVNAETYLTRFGTPLGARQYGEHVTTVLTDSAYESALSLTIRGDAGVQTLEA